MDEDGDFDDQSNMEPLDFIPLEVMPSSRLQDVVRGLERKDPLVVNLDAIVPSGESGVLVLKTILFKIKPSVKTISIRFNSLSPQCRDVLIEWIENNSSVEILYFMGSGFDDNGKKKLEDAWKKHLSAHRSDNLGYTLIRVYIDPNAPPEDPDA